VCAVELGVVVPPLVATNSGDGFFEFFPFKGNVWVVGVACTVVFDEDSAGFFITAVGDEPAGRLGQEPDADKDTSGRNTLKTEGESP